MIKENVIQEYFAWICEFVMKDRRCKKHSYNRLFSFLFDKEFTYIIDMDGNRAEDGINLRYRFSYANHYDDAVIASYLDNKPCSVLEMLIALSIRCEEDKMGDPAEGDRTSVWFWEMIDNLGLGEMSDDMFDEDVAEGIVYIFLTRQYRANGDGGLFTVDNPPRDMRTVEIWYQLCWYLNILLEH